MAAQRPFGMTTPCDNCPFRNDIRPYLTRGRVREIVQSLDRSSFPCHKTTTFDDEGEAVRTDKEMHCAGALILQEKMERPGQMLRIGERLGLYDRRKLDMAAPVFDTFDAMIEAQEDRRPRAKRRRA
jgi:hypothetical protein